MPIIGNNVIAFIPFDAACSDYDRLWMTNSLRGIVDYQVNIQSLDNDCSFGPEASGRVAENLFLIRKDLEGIMDTTNGEIKINEFQVKEIPKIIEEQLEKGIEVFGGKYFDTIPLYPGISSLKSDIKEAMINNRWKPTLTILGIDNCPKIEENGFCIINQ